MSETNEFSGLKMPVFTAFGWAGEETAIQFALSQMELFINELHARLPNNLKELLPFRGLSQTNQNAYLATEAEPENGLHIVFNPRTNSLELQLALSDKKALENAYKQIMKQPVLAHRLVTQLGPEWSVYVQQMQYDVESEEAAKYQDLFKDSISRFDDETAVSIFEKAAYLNGEEKWVVPLFVSRRFEAEKIAAMDLQILDVMLEELTNTLPLLTFLSGKVAKKTAAKKSTKKRTSTKATKTAAAQPTAQSAEDGFSYMSELKPLHIRKGFINLTPDHWPFFSKTSRTETRPVTVYYDGVYDKDSAVWRMLPNDRARLVLSPKVHEWLETTFSPDDSVQVAATKISSDEIQISLKPVGE